MATTSAGVITSLKTRNLVRSDTHINNEHGIVGSSKQIKELRRNIAVAANCDMPVLIVGEPGTGKELVANAIHKSTARRGKYEMSVVNCPAIPEELVESELFGHIRGAFTGGGQERKGLLPSGDQSTIFLDEISEFSFKIQAKILRFLQEMSITPVGSDKAKIVSARIISATNKDLESYIADGKFREDLYDRVNGYRINTTPLSQRPADIIELVWHFTDSPDPTKRVSEIEPELINMLHRQKFLGNVRELEKSLKRAIAEAASDSESRNAYSEIILRLNHIAGFKFRENSYTGSDSGPRASASEHNIPEVAETANVNLNGFDVFERMEIQLIAKTLKEANYKPIEAAKILGIKIKSLRYRLKKYGIK